MPNTRSSLLHRACGVILLIVHVVVSVPNCVVFGYNFYGNAGVNTSASPILTATYVVDAFGNNNVVAVAPGQFNTYFLSSNSTLFSTGLATNGRLGTNITSTATIFDIQTVRSDIKAIAAGYANGYALTTNGTVLAWGDSLYKALGQNSASLLYPQPILDDNNVLQGRAVKFISSGFNAVGIITNDGSLLTFGSNVNGLLGDGTVVDQYCPINIVDGLNIIQGRKFNFVYMTTTTAIAITTNGSVLTWGNYEGVGRVNNTHYPGYVNDTSSLLTGRTFVNAAGGSTGSKAHTVMVTNDGKVFTVGNNEFGQLCTGNSFTIASTAVAVHSSLNNVFIVKATAGALQTYLLSSNGTVYACGWSQE